MRPPRASSVSGPTAAVATRRRSCPLLLPSSSSCRRRCCGVIFSCTDDDPRLPLLRRRGGCQSPSARGTMHHGPGISHVLMTIKRQSSSAVAAPPLLLLRLTDFRLFEHEPEPRSLTGGGVRRRAAGRRGCDDAKEKRGEEGSSTTADNICRSDGALKSPPPEAGCDWLQYAMRSSPKAKKNRLPEGASPCVTRIHYF